MQIGINEGIFPIYSGYLILIFSSLVSSSGVQLRLSPVIIFSLFIPCILFSLKWIFVLCFVDCGLYYGTIPPLEAILLG